MCNLPFLTALCATSVLGHMQMTWPSPLHSKYNPATPENYRDYSMTAPLETYPCKGYINNPSSLMTSVDSWSAGSTVNYTVTGTATHGGGSCQLSMSYDQGATWSVIKSIMGGCMIDTLTEEVEIPKDAPSGEALFSWSWFNLLGNREMYQNCAPVTITDGGSGLDASSYPPPFVANVPQASSCKTIEHVNVVFPNPGANVKYGGTYASSKPTTPAGFTGNCGTSATGSGSGNSVVPSSNPSTTSSATSTRETLFTLSVSEGATVQTPSSSVDVAAASGSSTSTSPKKCTRKRYFGRADQHLLPRAHLHADVIRRADTSSSPKRVAALPATHLDHRRGMESWKRDPKRVAALPAEHLVRRKVDWERDVKRVAAVKAEHLA